MSVSPPEVKVNNSLSGQRVPGAATNAGGIIQVSARLKELLEPEEMEFILAHELAHHYKKHFLRQRVLLGFTFLLVALPFLRLTFNISPPANSLLEILFLVTPFVGFGLLFFGTQWLQREREHEADIQALSMTRNFPAAVNALTKLVKNSPLPHIHEVGTGSHPRMSKRIALLRAVARNRGLANVDYAE